MEMAAEPGSGGWGGSQALVVGGGQEQYIKFHLRVLWPYAGTILSNAASYVEQKRMLGTNQRSRAHLIIALSHLAP
jgi:hypothetical protein